MRQFGGLTYNVPSISEVAAEGSNAPMGKGAARSVYVVLYEDNTLFLIPPEVLYCSLWAVINASAT